MIRSIINSLLVPAMILSAATMTLNAGIHADGRGFFPVLVIAINSKTGEPLSGLEVQIENAGNPGTLVDGNKDLFNLLAEELGKPVATDARGIALVFHYSGWGSFDDNEHPENSTYSHGMTGTLVVRADGKDIYRKSLAEWAKRERYRTASNAASKIMLEIPPDKLPQPTNAPAKPAKQQIPARSVDSQVEIVGRLGLPLGEVCEIEAVAIDGDTTHMKANSGACLLRVMKVNGRDFPQDTMRFSTQHANLTALAPTTPEGRTAVLGKTFRLKVYETGEFDGVPSKLPTSARIWQGAAFGFTTHLMILEQLSPQVQTPEDRRR